MKIVYITRHFNHSGYAILQKLIADQVDLRAVVLHSKPDRWRSPYFRPFLLQGYQLKCGYYRCEPLRTTECEELLARRHDVPIIYTDSIRNPTCHNQIRACQPDLIVIGGGWHELLPLEVFEAAPFGCINTHPSLLPEFRGTSITRWQILEGVRTSGTTIHYVNEKFDSGGIVAQEPMTVAPNTTPQELFRQLGVLGADVMSRVVSRFQAEGPLSPFHREVESPYCKYYRRWQWNDEFLRIKWDQSLPEIHNHILACTQESYQYKGPWFVLQGQRYIARRSCLIGSSTESTPSTAHQNLGSTRKYVAELSPRGTLLISAPQTDLTLEVLSVQREGKYHWLGRADLPAKMIALRGTTTLTN